MAAKVPNPRKQFQFNIVMAGLNPFLAQEVKLPDQEFESVEHADTNFDVKTAGRKKIGSLTISKIQPGTTTDVFVKIFSTGIQNTATGGGMLPSQYKRDVLIEEYAPDGITVVERHSLSGVWLQKINGKELNRASSNNTLESLEFSVDEVN